MSFYFSNIGKGIVLIVFFGAAYLLGVKSLPVEEVASTETSGNPVSISGVQRTVVAPSLTVSSFAALGSSSPHSGQKAEELKGQILTLANINPIEALDFVRAQVKPMALAREIERAILEAWAVREPSSAWDWASEHSYWECCNTIKHIGRVNAELAWQCAKEFTASQPENYFMSYMSHRNVINGRVHEGNYQEALQFALSADFPTKNEDGAMSKTISHIFHTWAYHQPDEAKFQMEKFVAKNPEYRSFAEEAYYAAISLTAPEEALKLGQELPEDSPQRANVLSMAITRLAESEPMQAIEWLHENRENTTLDPQRRELAVKKDLIHENIDVALKLAASVTQEDYRRDAYMDLLVEWSLQDPQKAEEFLAENFVLSEEDQAQLKRTVRRKNIFADREEYVDGIY